MPACTGGPVSPERGEGAGAAAQHRHKHPRRRLAHPLDMPDQLVDPYRDLVAERCGHGVLAVRAPGDRHVGAALGKLRHARERAGDEPQKNRVRLAEHQQIAGLGDVLRRGTPVNPAAMRLADDAAKLPDQRHERVAGARKPFVDPRAIHPV